MSSTDPQLNDADDRPHRVIMLDVGTQREGDGWALLERPAEADTGLPSAEPQAPEFVDVNQLDQLVVDVASEPPVFSIGDLLTWPVEARQNLYRVVGEMQQPYTIRRGPNGEVYDDLFEFVIGIMEGDGNVARCEVGRQAAIEAAANLHPGAVIPSANRIIRRLRELGVQGVNVGDIQRQIRDMVEGLHAQQFLDQRPVLDALPTAPVARGCVTPPAWQLTNEGISLLAGGPVIAPPIVIVGQQHNVHGRPESLQLAFYQDGRWHGCLATRRQLGTTRKIQTLADHGFPVDAINARALVQYLHDFYQINAGHIPVARSSHRLGWLDAEDCDAFVLPTQVLTAYETLGVRPVASRRPEDFTADAVIFTPATEVAAAIARGVRSQGSYDGWLSAIAAIAPFPRVRFVLYASLTTPLLRILGTPNVVVDLCGPTSGGKTTAAAVAASAWGNPTENDFDSLLQSWDSTPAFREQLLGMFDGLPCLLDETRLAERVSDVAKTVYVAIKGRARGRGHLDPGAGLGGSSTVFISTGEVPICDLTQQGGVRGRTIPSWGSPFDATNRQINRTIQSLMAGIGSNFGFAGPLVVRNLLDHREQWDWLRLRYRQRQNELVERAGDRAAVCRLAGPLAALSMGAWLAHESLALPWPLEDPVDLLWSELVGEAQDSDRAEDALEHVLGWAVAHQHSFFGRRRGPSQPRRIWVGRWDPQGDWLGFMPNVLWEVLRAGGYDAAATVRMWRDRGWILVDRSSGKSRHRARVDGEHAWLVALRREVIEPIIGVPHVETDQGEQEGGTP